MAEIKKEREFGDGIEFDDVENFSSQEQQFSHQLLIMKCLTKCVDYGMIEMVEGKIETRVDKTGNVTTKYLPDTRRQFIEAVTTAKNFLKCDFDEETETKTKELLKKIKDIKEKWLKKELDWWNILPWELQQKLLRDGKGIVEGMHNQNHFFKDSSISEELDYWRLILEELNLLTKRLNFYERDTFIG